MEAIGRSVSEYMHYALGAGWHWFNSLSREEWLVVLAFVAVGGFLCLRGFGSRATH